MRLHFQATPVDLYAILGYLVVVVAAMAGYGLGTPFGLVLVFLVPGYLAMAALLPGKEDADWVMRGGLTLGLSLALVAFLGIVLNYSPFGITFWSALTAVLILCLVLWVLALRRRMRLPASDRMEGNLAFEWIGWRDYSAVERGLAVALILVLAVSAPFVGTALLQPRSAPGFTELYLLGPSGNFTDYPTRLNVSQGAAVQVVVANHEGGSRGYSLRVDLVGVRLVYNGSTGKNSTLELNRTTLQTLPFSLGNQGVWTQNYAFAITSPGTWWLQFLLSMDGNPLSPYHEVHLLITVT